ncbi:Casein kinase I protein isoform 1 [Hibiscus syriacus]|uniref:Casein kinase I protein isoform 1 n=1 Tax=Hibiscus syriacus TaxID=106335 RepID=A0A6A2WI68_HIBSY|nr:uncharacterized protein LOC120195918 [Hibiscus syriacus]KAE8655675.1 Casein kinase I protein isoform 1 [Hibiscus syriacus]
MEQNLPVMAKRVWSIVRAALFMMKKGILSKPKFMLHLNVRLKRGKVASAKAISLRSTNSYYQNFFACTHAPPTHEDDDIATVKAVIEMLNDNSNVGGAVVAASPMLPGFGQTPLVRQLRITDSPFPLRDAGEGNGTVDKAAEEFIKRFYEDLKLQN